MNDHVAWGKKTETHLCPAPLLFLLLETRENNGNGHGRVPLEAINDLLSLLGVNPLDGLLIDDLR